VTAESWLNNAATNENRGKSLSLYLIVQMLGIIAAQGLLVLADPSGYTLFVISSVLVSVSFAPILLSVKPTPTFETAKPMTLRSLYKVSPLGCVGMFLLGGIFSAQFGMSAVYATRIGLELTEISLFIATIYIGAVVLQYPIGWLSDRMDRRVLILAVAVAGALAAYVGVFFGGSFQVLLGVGFVVGGLSNPLYSLLLAYTNDFLELEDMAAASGGMVFINGMGAIAGPLITGWLMDIAGPSGFWLYISVLMVALAGYAAYRMTQRAAVAGAHTGTYVGVSPSASALAIEAAQEWAVEAADDDQS